MNPRKLEGWESVTILYKQCNLAVKASWKYSCIRKLLHHRSVSRTTLQHRIFHLVSFLYRFMNPTCGHFKTMPPRCPDTQDLHINVPPGPFNSAEKGHNLGFVPGLSAPWSGSRVMQPLFTLPEPWEHLCSPGQQSWGRRRRGKGPKDSLGARLGGRMTRCINLFALLLHRKPPRGSVQTLHMGIHAARPQSSPSRFI